MKSQHIVHGYKEGELRSLFTVTGYFYEHNDFPCRKFLHIRTAGELADTPDLMVVMMNPGASMPLNDGNNGRVEARAEPDETQYAVMRVMQGKGFRFARILNLSDLRERNSNAFARNLRILEKRYPEHCRGLTAPRFSLGVLSSAAETLQKLGRQNRCCPLSDVRRVTDGRPFRLP